MSGEAAFINVIIVYALPLLLAIAWIVFVVRQRRWRLSTRIVAGSVGTLMILFVAWYMLFFIFAELVGGPADTNPQPTPTLAPIFEVAPATPT